MKVYLDKYYTPIEIANYCYNKVIELIGEDNIKYYLMMNIIQQNIK